MSSYPQCRTFFQLLSLALVVLFSIWVRAAVEDTHAFMAKHTKDKNIGSIKDAITVLDKDPALYSQLGLTASILYSTSCAFEIYGAYMCKEMLLLPYIILTFLLNMAFIGLNIVVTRLIKENSQDLGLLIGVTLSGSFLLIFLLYCLACVYSLWQVLREPKLRGLAEDTLNFIGGARQARKSVRGGPRSLPNLRDDLRYTRQSPHATNMGMVSHHLPNSGAGLLDARNGGEHNIITSRRVRYPNRPFPGIPYPTRAVGGYGTMIAPIY